MLRDPVSSWCSVSPMDPQFTVVTETCPPLTLFSFHCYYGHPGTPCFHGESLHCFLRGGGEEEVPLPRVRLTAGCSLCAGLGSHCCGARTPLFGCGHTYGHFWACRFLSPKGLEGANFGVWLCHGLDFPNPLPFLLFLPTAPPLHCTSTHATLNLRKTPGPLCK